MVDWLHKTTLICNLCFEGAKGDRIEIGTCSCHDACLLTVWITYLLGLTALIALLKMVMGCIFSSTIVFTIMFGEAIICQSYYLLVLLSCESNINITSFAAMV